MNQNLNHLIRALRDELQQYGEMLVRLDRHHQQAAFQSGRHGCAFASEIQMQSEVIQRARRQREQACREVAGTLHLTALVPLEEMIPWLPADYQPLVNELARENRQLLDQVVESLQRK
jgi:hypothetical protein